MKFVEQVCLGTGNNRLDFEGGLPKAGRCVAFLIFLPPRA